MGSENQRSSAKEITHPAGIVAKPANASAPDEQLLREIVRRITAHVNVKHIILFGSYATGKVHEDSDIDLVVVLDEPGFARDYEEKLNRWRRIKRLIFDISIQISVDLLVYTRDEWAKLLELNSSFIRDIRKTGVSLV